MRLRRCNACATATLRPWKIRATTAGDDTAGDDTAGDDTAGDDTEATLGGDVPTTDDTGDAAASDRDTATKDTPTDEPQTASQERTDEPSSVGVEASVGDDDLAGDEPAGVAG